MISIPVSLADNALMMGGTTQPTPSADWMNAIINNYIDPATGNTYTPVAVTTPETLAWTSSVQHGLADLQAAMAQQDRPYLVEGYSQSAAIAVDEKSLLIDTGQQPDVTFVLFGSLNRPDGGVLERFSGLFVPGFDAGANGAEPTDATIPTIDIAGQYDPLADFPQYPINLVADLNAFLGAIYVHSAYGPILPSVTGSVPPLTGPLTDQYVLGSTEIVKQVTGDTTFYFIPTTELPLLDPLRTLGVPESLLNTVQPALQVIVEAGYDRSIPFGDPTPAQLIPTLDPVTFIAELGKAVVQGANNAFEVVGAQLPGATELESLLDTAQSWSEQHIGVPYYDAASWFNDNINPIAAVLQLEGPIGQDIQNVLDLTGIQQQVLDPVIELFPPIVALLGG